MGQDKADNFLSEVVRLLIVLLSWILGVFFVLVGLVEISNKSMLSGFIIFFAGVLLLPIVKREINNKLKTNIKLKYFNAFAFLLLFVGLIISPKGKDEGVDKTINPQPIITVNTSETVPQTVIKETKNHEANLKYDEALSYFKGKDEPKVKDAIWTSKKMFKVGVSDDGTSRDGYAEYVCMKLHDFGFKDQGVFVQVIDYDKLMKTEDWVKLGVAQCS